MGERNVNRRVPFYYIIFSTTRTELRCNYLRPDVSINTLGSNTLLCQVLITKFFPVFIFMVLVDWKGVNWTNSWSLKVIAAEAYLFCWPGETTR